MRLLAQVKRDRTAVGRQLDSLGDQAVEGKRLVGAARQQTLIDVVAQTRCAHPLDDERVEAVEGAKFPKHEPSTLRRLRVDVGKMRHVRGMLGLPIHRNAMDHLAGAGSGKKACEKQDSRGCAQKNHLLTAKALRATAKLEGASFCGVMSLWYGMAP